MKKRRKPDADLHGILVVDKPEGFTSFDVIAKLRGVLGTRRIGHTGTLDPMATGVLVLFVGNATKAVDMAKSEDKVYKARMQLGQKTDTGDITGEVVEQAPVTAGETELLAVLPRFTGQMAQLPPMYSAVKMNGQPLYRLARQGQTVERRPRPIEVYDIQYLGTPAPGLFELLIHCSKGTYIRTLLEDIGEAMGQKATMATLRRIRSGPYAIEAALSLSEVEQAAAAGEAARLLTPVESVFLDYPRLEVSEKLKKQLENGVITESKLEDNKYAVYCNGAFVGVAETCEGRLRVVRLFARPAAPFGEKQGEAIEEI